MRTALISFHKNIGRYPIEWIEKYRDSIINQTNKDFDIFELNYGGGEERIFENSKFISLNLNDHAQAHNYLLERCFSLGYDLILNTNVDDKYPLERVKLQIDNFDPEVSVISGNYISFSETRENIHGTKFHELDIFKEFSNNHNIVAHPACAYTRKILDYNEKLISEEIASDDFCMWKRLLSKGAKFKIIPDVLLYYRISELKTKA
jgi:hypothetical protein